jgi:glutamate N-acetyltransferase / amino-acid N-acetyltransferase
MVKLNFPRGFQTFVSNLGIKDKTLDFVCVKSDVRCVTAGVFTQSHFAGPSVILSRQNIQSNSAQAVVVISKNANVANGAVGFENAKEILDIVANEAEIPSNDILISSTGVIGRPYPMDKIRNGLRGMGGKFESADFISVAQGIMTTDTVSKISTKTIGQSSIIGVAKGVAMLEPNMATLLTFFFTDAYIQPDTLKIIFQSVMDKTFNCLSIDSDTSTSDSAIILSNGLAGKVDEDEFTSALEEVSLELVHMIAKDGEGATKIIEVIVDEAASYIQAKQVAKTIVNSPLVKTAVYGADPNWGRVAMAIGKCKYAVGIDQDKVIIRFGDLAVYPEQYNPDVLSQLREIMARQKVVIHVSLAMGEYSATVWGCDLSERYVEINSKYST